MGIRKEKAALRIAVQVFASKMVQVLFNKSEEGYSGWNTAELKEEVLLDKIKADVEEGNPAKMIDVANRAMVIWFKNVSLPNFESISLSLAPFNIEFNELASYVYKMACSKGWWDNDRNVGECIALMHSELSEGLEWLRNGNGRSNHIPDFLGIEEELADVIIRIMDFSAGKGYRVGEAVVEKIKFNESRPIKHSNKKF